MNILTCAAPNLRERPSNIMNPHAGNVAAKITPSELEKLLTARICRIFEIAVANENEVLILGAFGCGAFRNPPEIVARVFNKVMQDYAGHNYSFTQYLAGQFMDMGFDGVIFGSSLDSKGENFVFFYPKDCIAINSRLFMVDDISIKYSSISRLDFKYFD